ncbi:MAG: hypothetical protein OD811_01965 [Alphaproteobacteria bacterium]
MIWHFALGLDALGLEFGVFVGLGQVGVVEGGRLRVTGRFLGDFVSLLYYFTPFVGHLDEFVDEFAGLVVRGFWI